MGAQKCLQWGLRSGSGGGSEVAKLPEVAKLAKLSPHVAFVLGHSICNVMLHCAMFNFMGNVVMIFAQI
jgi:hypothetical protein